MKLVVLTGGIGAGKSSVTTRLVARGAVIVDADAIVRELQAPGMPLLQVLADHFGAHIINADGSLDRAGLAAIAFKDDESTQALNELVHPAVRAEIRRRIAAERDSDRIVVLDTPLLTVIDGLAFDGMVVVDTPIEVAVARVVEQRGLPEDDVRARIDKQISRDERRALADFVVDNGGDLPQLEAQVDALWAWIEALPASN